MLLELPLFVKVYIKKQAIATAATIPPATFMVIECPVGSISLVGPFPTYPYKFTPPEYPMGYLMRNLP